MTLFDVRRTKNNPRDQTPKKIKPANPRGPRVHTMGGAHDPVNFTRDKIRQIPGVSPFLRRHGGNIVSGWSGIVPFVRTFGGQVIAPGIRTRK